MKKKESKKIVVIGIAGTALNIIEQVRDAEQNHGMAVRIEGVIIDTLPAGEMVAGVPVLGNRADVPVILKDPSLSFIFALYKPDFLRERWMILQSLSIPPERFIGFIHPRAYVAPGVTAGTGNVILGNSSVMSGVSLGDFNIINAGVVIEHETHIGNGNYIAAGACIGARVTISNHCFIGLNSSVREDVTLGSEMFVGMHSLVLEDFTGCRIAGVPARKMQ